MYLSPSNLGNKVNVIQNMSDKRGGVHVSVIDLCPSRLFYDQLRGLFLEIPGNFSG